jgi:hypothetical protein
MKRLLFALLVSSTAILGAGQPPKVEADCIYRRYFYYTTASYGTECGSTYIYCSAPTYHTGCTTPYYHVYAGCACP